MMRNCSILRLWRFRTWKMLDDPLAEVNTQADNLQLWWRNTDGMTVDDLLEECKQEMNI